MAYAVFTDGMSMENRAAFDRLLAEGVPAVATPAAPIPREPDDAAIVRQNREALASWASLGVPVTAA